MVARMRAPVAPTGWPREMPDPLGLSRSSVGSTFHSRRQASTWAANASLSSIRSISSRVSPARSRAAAVAGTGPMPITSGPTPATAHDLSASSGRRPRRSASSRVVTTHIAAPSFWPLALPAVTVEASSIFWRTGRSAASCSRVVSGRGCSSRSTTTSGLPRRPGTVTGTSSSANRPASWAAPARCWERTESSSCSSREMSYCLRRFSAVSSMPPGTGWSLPPAVSRARTRRSISSTEPPLTPVRRPRA